MHQIAKPKRETIKMAKNFIENHKGQGIGHRGKTCQNEPPSEKQSIYEHIYEQRDKQRGLQTHTPVSLEDILYCHIHVYLRGHLISKQPLVHFKCRDGPYVVFFKHRTVPSGNVYQPVISYMARKLKLKCVHHIIIVGIHTMICI